MAFRRNLTIGSIGQTKLNFEDLLAPLAGQSENLDSLKKSTKVLTSSKNKALSAPLPQRTQDRLDREAAYEQTKQEVDKWQDTMKQIKEVCNLKPWLSDAERKFVGRTP